MTQEFLHGLAEPLVQIAVRNALLEDFASAGDITTQLTIPDEARTTCKIVAREAGFLSGVQLAREAFAQVSDEVKFSNSVQDGGELQPGQTVMRFEGPAKAILSAERVALNFIGHMSGIATLTSHYAKLIEDLPANVCCTRKTTPCMRAFEKYAVKCGGGVNHRFGLYDAVLIKDNHIAIAGGMDPIIARLKAQPSGHMVKTEIEVDTLDQLRELEPFLGKLIHAVLLDNMGPDILKEAVGIIDGRAVAEASGGVNLETLRDIAESGVDLISVGALTHSAKTLDLGLDYEE